MAGVEFINSSKELGPCIVAFRKHPNGIEVQMVDTRYGYENRVRYAALLPFDVLDEIRDNVVGLDIGVLIYKAVDRDEIDGFIKAQK